jgi:hypothetical protein
MREERIRHGKGWQHLNRVIVFIALDMGIAISGTVSATAIRECVGNPLKSSSPMDTSNPSQ